MSDFLIDAYGSRKYIVPRERAAFVAAALRKEAAIAAFCLTLAITGVRISEALALESNGIDVANECVVIRTLKQRNKTKFRMVPAPAFLLERLLRLSGGGNHLWTFRRIFAWYQVKAVMQMAGIAEAQCMPKALRHGFAVEAILSGVPLSLLQKWMGHSRLETTSIYTNIIGKEEAEFAQRTWRALSS